ncbi:MAG: hypothetical protein AAGG07_05645 [Planctomycetota bacterium]
MLKIADGQCGMCAHFGEHDNKPELVQIRVKGEAPEGMVESCGHPQMAPLKLEVAPTSGCSGFTPAKSA